jgi:enoyl-CoA hydratase
MADRLLDYSPTALRWQKRVLNRWLPVDLETAIQFSIEAFSACYATTEPREAMSAFLEKRKARFDGDS